MPDIPIAPKPPPLAATRRRPAPRLGPEEALEAACKEGLTAGRGYALGSFVASEAPSS